MQTKPTPIVYIYWLFTYGAPLLAPNHYMVRALLLWATAEGACWAKASAELDDWLAS